MGKAQRVRPWREVVIAVNPNTAAPMPVPALVDRRGGAALRAGPLTSVRVALAPMESQIIAA